jgi:hypothetical protein
LTLEPLTSQMVPEEAGAFLGGLTFASILSGSAHTVKPTETRSENINEDCLWEVWIEGQKDSTRFLPPGSLRSLHPGCSHVLQSSPGMFLTP